MITRKIGKIVRGKATPYQVFTAALLGAMLAFLPAFDQAAGLYVLLACALLVLNANLFVAAIVALPAKLVALAAVPVSFAVGRALLDGPLAPIFRWLVNAPVSAYFGLEYYVTTGGLVLGLVFGATTGWLLVASLQRLRETFAGLERDSERFWELTRKRWVKVTTFVFLGGRGKKSYEEIMRKRVGNPVRPFGVAVILVFFAFTLAFRSLLASSYMANALQSTLERTNGATVDVAGLDLDIGGGHLRIDGLAMADRDDLGRDVFRGLTFEADISTTDLLRKRFTIERLVIDQASSGKKRAVRGKRVDSQQEEPQPVAEDPDADALGLEDVFEDAKLWRERMKTAQRWIERLAPEASEEEEADTGESLSERLARQARESGYGDLRATHLIVDHPRFLISELVVNGLVVESVEDETFDVRALNLTTQPHLLDGSPRVEITTASGHTRVVVGGDRLELEVVGLPVDEIAASLQFEGERPVAGGTVDLALNGRWDRAGVLDLPLAVTLHDCLITIPQHGPVVVDRFELPIALRGPLGDLTMRIDDEELTRALIEAGQAELARRLEAEAEARLTELGGAVQEELTEKLDEELAEHGIDKEEAAEELEKKAGGLLRGLLKRD